MMLVGEGIPGIALYRWFVLVLCLSVDEPWGRGVIGLKDLANIVGFRVLSATRALVDLCFRVTPRSLKRPGDARCVNCKPQSHLLAISTMAEIQPAGFADIAPLLGRMGRSPPNTVIMASTNMMRSLRSH
jgi:hypothetical protein